LLFIFGVSLRFAGVTPRVRRTCPGEPGADIVPEPFARSGDFSMVDAVFTAGQLSSRYRVLLSRPEDYAIVRNSRKLANESQYCFFKRLIGAKKLARARAFEWL
jgi:hypothetical protein